MEVTLFDRKDTKIVNSWLEQRGMLGISRAHLPNIGYMATHKEKPIACGFIRYVEGGLMCHLDSLATDPIAPPEVRNEAINSIVEALMKSAKELGYKAVFAYSTDEHTLERSRKFGFSVLPHVLIVADI